MSSPVLSPRPNFWLVDHHILSYSIIKPTYLALKYPSTKLAYELIMMSLLFLCPTHPTLSPYIILNLVTTSLEMKIQACFNLVVSRSRSYSWIYIQRDQGVFFNWPVLTHIERCWKALWCHSLYLLSPLAGCNAQMNLQTYQVAMFIQGITHIHTLLFCIYTTDHIKRIACAQTLSLQTEFWYSFFFFKPCKQRSLSQLRCM